MCISAAGGDRWFVSDVVEAHAMTTNLFDSSFLTIDSSRNNGWGRKVLQVGCFKHEGPLSARKSFCMKTFAVKTSLSPHPLL